MVLGVSDGFKKELQLLGVGYRASVSGKELTMNLGYSHPVVMEIPKDVTVEVSLLWWHTICFLSISPSLT